MTRPSPAYQRYFRGIPSGDTVEAARRDVERLDTKYRLFERLGDRAGMHETELVALTMRNRFRRRRKADVAAVFLEWLVAHDSDDTPKSRRFRG